MLCRRDLLLGSVAVAGSMPLVVSVAWAEDYPTRTIKVVVSQPPGGLMDILPRILGQKITEKTGQAVVVENRLGGNGAVAGAEVARAEPDGYTLMMGFHGVNAMLPHMTSKLGFEPEKAFVPIVHILSVPNILVVHPSVPAQSLAELVAYAKAHPGKLSFASQGVGSTGHVAGELLKQRAGIDIVHIPFRGAAPAQQAVVSGEVSMMFDAVALSIESVKAEKLRGLGIASQHRIPSLSDVPTLKQAGLDFEISSWFGLMAPAATSHAVVAWLNRMANDVFSAPEMRDRYLAQGATLPLGAPEAFGSHIASEYRKWGPVIRQANIRID